MLIHVKMRHLAEALLACSVEETQLSLICGNSSHGGHMCMTEKGYCYTKKVIVNCFLFFVLVLVFSCKNPLMSLLIGFVADGLSYVLHVRGFSGLL